MGIASAKLKKNSKACDLSMNSFRMRDMRLTPTLLDIDSPEQFHDFYRLGPCIGSGQYVEVRTCFHRNSDMKRCVKIYRKDLMTTDATKNALELEYGILQSLNHPNIIRLIDHFVESRRIYAVLEFCSLGELYSEIIRKKKLDESVASNIMKQLFSGVAYMHQRNICHRNIKPENILLNEDQIGINVKLTHFGSATHYESNKQIKGTQGTSYYISPEVLGGTYNEKCDLWSCGVILYILLAGYPPFNGKDDDEVIKQVKIGLYTLEAEPWPNISSDARDLITKLLVPANERISAAEALDHYWFADKSYRVEVIEAD